MGLNVRGGTSGIDADVDSTPKALRSAIYEPGGTPLAKADGAAMPVTPYALPMMGHDAGVARILRTDEAGAAAQLRSLIHFEDPCDGATANPLMWTDAVSTMTIVQATRLTTLNAGNSVANTVSAQRISPAFFRKVRGSVLRYSGRFRFDWNNSGSVMECGFGVPSGVVANVPNGAYLRMAADGTVAGIVSYASSETSTGTVAAQGVLVASRYYDVDVIVYDDVVQFVVQASGDVVDTPVAPVIDVALPLGNAAIAEWAQISTPAFVRIYNSSSMAAANHLIYSSIRVYSQGQDNNKPWADQLVSANGTAGLCNPATGAQLANYANAAAPASATLSNTAAGYTTLGGQWQFAAVAGAETDYALFGYTVPTGRRLYVRGVQIETFNTVVAVATTATVFQWGVGRAAAVTLAANSFRKTIGVQNFAIGAAVAAQANTIAWRPTSPLICESGQIFHIILKMPIGTATATEIFRGIVDVDWYME